MSNLVVVRPFGDAMGDSVFFFQIGSVREGEHVNVCPGMCVSYYFFVFVVDEVMKYFVIQPVTLSYVCPTICRATGNVNTYLDNE